MAVWWQSHQYSSRSGMHHQGTWLLQMQKRLDRNRQFDFCVFFCQIITKIMMTCFATVTTNSTFLPIRFSFQGSLSVFIRWCTFCDNANENAKLYCQSKTKIIHFYPHLHNLPSPLSKLETNMLPIAGQ